MKKLPNFLLVGAAKSGTTSLYFYLSQHPEIYMSPIKEPKFLTTKIVKFPHKGPGDEIVDRGVVKDFHSYKALFENVREEKAIGEASADTLYYYQCIPFIKEVLGNVKILIILRNPVDRAFSAYAHMVRDGRETLSFERALEEEEKRIKDNWEFIWHYKRVGLYYEQIKAFMEAFSETKIVLFDDLKTSPLKLIKDIYRFLGVNPAFTPNLSIKYNVSEIPRFRKLQEFLLEDKPVKLHIKKGLTRLVPSAYISKARNFVLKMNLRRLKIKAKTRKKLIEYYKEDIVKLSKLIGRDLSSWLR